MVPYRDGSTIDENSSIFWYTEYASCHQQGMQMVKLCSNRITQFLTWVPVNTGLLYTGCNALVV